MTGLKISDNGGCMVTKSLTVGRTIGRSRKTSMEQEYWMSNPRKIRSMPYLYWERDARS